MIQINGWLLLAQIASFLVALFILWRFFWGPLTQMIEKRRSDITKDIEGAKSGREEVERVKQQYQAELSEIESRAKKILDAATADGQVAREEILKAAQEQARAFLDNAKAEIAVERDLAMTQMRKETVDLAVLIAEKILKQSVDQGTRERMLSEFIDGLKHG
ncbi:MAG TPA: F0F1 ATP synthase subunit B [bacterium]|nr:F0F1 ATP synthase subunit B [bacterium]